MENLGGIERDDPGGGACAESVNDATRGVGPFPDKGAILPSTEQKRAEDAAKSAGGMQRVYTGQEGTNGKPGADKTKIY